MAHRQVQQQRYAEEVNLWVERTGEVVQAAQGAAQVSRDRQRIENTKATLQRHQLEREVGRQLRIEQARFEQTMQSPLDNLDDANLERWKEIERPVRKRVFNNWRQYSNI